MVKRSILDELCLFSSPKRSRQISAISGESGYSSGDSSAEDNLPEYEVVGIGSEFDVWPCEFDVFSLEQGEVMDMIPLEELSYSPVSDLALNNAVDLLSAGTTNKEILSTMESSSIDANSLVYGQIDVIDLFCNLESKCSGDVKPEKIPVEPQREEGGFGCPNNSGGGELEGEVSPEKILVETQIDGTGSPKNVFGDGSCATAEAINSRELIGLTEKSEDRFQEKWVGGDGITKGDSHRRSAGASNLTALDKPIDEKSSHTLVLNKNENCRELLANFVKGAHVMTKFHCTVDGGKRPRKISFSDLIPFLEEKFKISDQITIKKTVDSKYVDQFMNQKIDRKRAVATCGNLIRGLALAEVDERLRADMDLSLKQKSNRFTNFQRTDRSGGERLEKEFSVKYNISYGTEISTVEEQCSTSLMIFDKDGNLEYYSGKSCEFSVQFFKTEHEFYLVRNFKAFCKL